MLESLAQHFAVRKSFRIRHETRSHGPNGLVLASPFLDGEPTVPLAQVTETFRRSPPDFIGPVGNRPLLRPLLRQFVELGIGEPNPSGHG